MAFKWKDREPDPVSPEFQALIDRGNVTLAEYKQLRGNSRDWNAIVPALNDEALVHVAKYCADNMSRGMPSTYDHAMVNVYLPEVLKRLGGKAGT